MQNNSLVSLNWVHAGVLSTQAHQSVHTQQCLSTDDYMSPTDADSVSMLVKSVNVILSML